MKLGHYLKQKAVYWDSPIPDGFGGATYTAPTEIDVRWEDRVEQYTNLAGQQALSNAIVYANRDFSVGCYIMLGLLSDVTDPGLDPQKTPGALKIMMVAKSPNIKGTQFLRKAWL